MITWLKRHCREHQVASIFLGFALVFGGLFIVLTPLTQSADETTHFYRAFQLSEGHVFSTKVEDGYGAVLPRDTYVVTRQLFADIPSHYERKFNYRQVAPLLKRKLNPQDRIPVHVEGATVYSPVGYIPQVVAIWIARLVWPSVALMYYLGRFVNLLVWAGLIYGAIRLWPGNKWAVFALALMPMSLSQGASFSPDALTNSLAIFVVSAAMYLSRSGKRLDKKTIVASFVAIIGLSLCKPVFFAFGLLTLLLKPKQLGGNRRYWLFVGSLVAGALLATALWNIPVEKYTLAIQHYYLPGQNISRPEQMSFMLHQPLSFIMIIARTFFTNTGDLVAKTFVGRLGWWDVDLPLWIICSTYALLGLAFITSGNKRQEPSSRQRLITLGVFGISFALINAALYLTVTEVAKPVISGLQGRYFIPIALLLAVGAGSWLRVVDWEKLAPRIFIPGYVVILASSLIVMVNRFI